MLLTQGKLMKLFVVFNFFFFVIYCWVLVWCAQYPEDDGSCVKLLTREQCEEPRAVLDTSMQQCTWHADLSADVQYDNYFSCRFQAPILSWQVCILLLGRDYY